MAESIRGNKTLSGTWGELWIDGEKIFEFSKIELKVTANREEVQIGIDAVSYTHLSFRGLGKIIPRRCGRIRISWRLLPEGN